MEQKKQIVLPASARPVGKAVHVLLGEGFDEIEAIAAIDVMRRGGMEVYSVSMSEERLVTGATGNRILADMAVTELVSDRIDWLLLPGAARGEAAVTPDERIRNLILEHWQRGGGIAAICAAPALVLGPLGLLDGVEATGYPPLKEELLRAGARYSEAPVVAGERLITSQGPGTTLEFALALVRRVKGPETERLLREGMVVPPTPCPEPCACSEGGSCSCGESTCECGGDGSCSCGENACGCEDNACACSGDGSCSCSESTCDCGDSCGCEDNACACSGDGSCSCGENACECGDSCGCADK